MSSTRDAGSDDVLVRRAVRLRDQQAFADLLRRHQERILLLQRRLTGERSLAEDLAQETFLRAWEKLGSYRGPDRFGAWLASLSYNVFRAHWRRSRRQRQEVALGDLDPAARETEEGALADLERLLAVLHRDDQVMLVLTYAYGLSTPEVAEVLEKPAGTVKARIHRAKKRLRAELEAPPSAKPVEADETPADEGRKPDTTAWRRQPSQRLKPARKAVIVSV